ncbi:MAG: MCE family protein [Gammaproteobacteria bacterium]|nr:MAG: MCE family protein [Gammaproteobacteria bacterium]
MSKKANPTVVGAFVLGAMALALGGMFFFGSGKFFREVDTNVAFFEGSLKGLEIGAPVTFRGVRIGTVKDIRVVYDTDKAELKIPVIFEVDLDRLTVIGDSDPTADDHEDGDILIERGMRAQLELRSLVTGQLAVNLDFFPGTKAVYHGGYEGHDEYPTVPSEVEQLRGAAQKIIRQIQDVPFDEIADAIQATLEGMEKIVTSNELAGAISGADRLMNSQDLQASLKGLRRALDSADAAMRSVRELADHADDQVGPLVDGLRQASDEFGDILQKAATVLESVELSLDEDSDLRVRTITAMEEVAAAARSVRVLADYIERHPEALIKGKKEAGR